MLRVARRAACALRAPYARSAGGWAPSDTDRVLLSGLLFHGYHGVLPAEQSLGQKFAVDVALTLDLRAAGRSDDLTQTVSYAEVYECAHADARAAARCSSAHARVQPRSCVRQVVQGPPRQLVEAVAQDVAAAVLRGFPLAQAVNVRVVKPHVAMPGALDSLGACRQRVRLVSPGCLHLTEVRVLWQVWKSIGSAATQACSEAPRTRVQ